MNVQILLAALFLHCSSRVSSASVEIIRQVVDSMKAEFANRQKSKMLSDIKTLLSSSNPDKNPDSLPPVQDYDPGYCL
jgi:hypothetical protein